MKTKICLVNHGAWPVISGSPVKGVSPGGEEVQHALLARALAARGLDVTLIVGDYGQGPESTIDGVRVLHSFAIADGLPGLRAIHPRFTGLWRALKRADAGTYYVSCAGSVVGYVAAFCRMFGRRFVFRVASDSDCDPERLIILNRRDEWLYRYGLPRADEILVQTAHQRDLLMRNFGVRSEIADMLVELPEGDPMARERDIDVLWLANLRSVKRPDWVVELARLLPNVRFTMAGGVYGAQQALYESVQARAADLPNLEFLRAVPFGATASLFGRARLFLNTSELEGFPNTYLQAWANRTPIVATFDPDGLINALSMGVATKTLPETAAAIERLLQNEGERYGAGLRGREYVEAHHGHAAVERYATFLAGRPCASRKLAAVGGDVST